MVMLHLDQSMSFALDEGSDCPYLEVKNVGELKPDLTSKISSLLTDLVSSNLRVPANRVYIEFQESQRHLWGWNGGTFG